MSCVETMPSSKVGGQGWEGDRGIAIWCNEQANCCKGQGSEGRGTGRFDRANTSRATKKLNRNWSSCRPHGAQSHAEVLQSIASLVCKHQEIWSRPSFVWEVSLICHRAIRSLTASGWNQIWNVIVSMQPSLFEWEDKGADRQDVHSSNECCHFSAAAEKWCDADE